VRYAGIKDTWRLTTKTMRSRMMLLGCVAIVTFLLGGCAGLNKTVLHPIDKADITRMEKGVAYTSDRDGYFLSDMYVEEVMQAKVDKVKL